MLKMPIYNCNAYYEIYIYEVLCVYMYILNSNTVLVVVLVLDITVQSMI